MRFLYQAAIFVLALLRNVDAKAVFAHFMVGNTAHYSDADWQDDISKAQAAHIDAFALNMAFDEATNENSIKNVFRIAESAGFKLFFSFDYAGNGLWPKEDVISFIQRYRSSSAYFQYAGKPFVSTFEGPEAANDWSSIKSSTGCFFVPDWSSTGAKRALELNKGVADGLFSWAAWPWGPQDMDTYVDASYDQYLSGKPYMMPVSPWFYTNLPGYKKNWMWRGDDLWFDRWQQVNFWQPEFVEIISWNDYGESHHIGPYRDHAMEAFTVGKAPYNYATDMPHDAWREFLPYTIDTYKKNQSTITQEGLTGWWRINPSTACGDGGTTGNTASQLQIEYPPKDIMLDGIFYSALLGSQADVIVTVGGKKLDAHWRIQPDTGAGMYHGSVPYGDARGDVVITLVRRQATLMTLTGKAITTTCQKGLTNWNPWVGYAKGPSVSVTPTSLSKQGCIQGTGANAFQGLCNYGCQYDYCPKGACLCQQMGTRLKRPVPENVTAYPAPGLDANYDGLCAFDCNYGYCPSDKCAFSESPRSTPTVSPFLPPACTKGEGTHPFAGLCSYACNFGFCPMAVCKCTAKGALNEPPAKVKQGGKPLSTTGDDHGLCEFACSRGYCPEDACSPPENPSANDVYVDPSIWSSTMPVVSCIPPCTYILPPYKYTTPTTIKFPPLTTTISMSYKGKAPTSTVITATFPPVTTTEIPVFNLNITTGSVDGVTYRITPSIIPTFVWTITPPKSWSVTETPSAITIYSTPKPDNSVTVTDKDKPTQVSHKSASPAGPTCKSGCGNKCQQNCNSCGTSCGGICRGCGPGGAGCVGLACPKDGGGGGGGGGGDPNDPDRTSCATTKTVSSCQVGLVTIGTTTKSTSTCRAVQGCSVTATTETRSHVQIPAPIETKTPFTQPTPGIDDGAYQQAEQDANQILAKLPKACAKTSPAKSIFYLHRFTYVGTQSQTSYTGIIKKSEFGCNMPFSSFTLPNSYPVTTNDPPTSFTIDPKGMCGANLLTFTKQCDGSYWVTAKDQGGRARCTTQNLPAEITCANNGGKQTARVMMSCKGNICK